MRKAGAFLLVQAFVTVEKESLAARCFRSVFLTSDTNCTSSPVYKVFEIAETTQPVFITAVLTVKIITDQVQSK